MNVSVENSRISPHEALDWAHPLVAQWFKARFGTPTEPQIAGWPRILAGDTTLIAAPTGSGKTLAAFLVCIDKLVRKALEGKLSNRTEVIYISPLKALSNDVEKNLQVPLKEILELAMAQGYLMPEIRTMVRTGDTLQVDRRSMLKRPPHILVTTPESFYIMLTAEKTRAILMDVETVIVDEIHALADDKRGVHMSLSLERLEVLTGRPPTRIGLSATQKPVEYTAQFLAGNDRPLPFIVDVGHKRQLDIAVEVPTMELGAVASNEMWDEIYQKLAKLVTEHTSTLIFVNTRKLAERVAHNLLELLGEDSVLAHHGSLSRELRLEAERRLKAGELKALVATASLELGIDVGAIDLVCQISSPRNIAVALQRIGRAGHWRGAIPKGRLFATTRDDLLECASLIKSINEGDLDRLIIPKASLDVLCQQLVAACSTQDWQEDDLFKLVRHSYPFRELERTEFDQVVEMLSSGLSDVRARYGAFLVRDRVNGLVKARRGSRLASITNAGAIPETALFTVLTEPEGLVVGTVDEDFAVESSAGDVMLLGSTSWMITKVEGKGGRVWVVDANGAPPNVPFWRGEAPGRTRELSHHLSEVREKISHLALSVPGFKTSNVPDDDLDDEFIRAENSKEKFGVPCAIDWLVQSCGLDEHAAGQAVSYVLEGQALLGGIPSEKLVIAERFFDEAGGMQLVIHSPFGSRINKAWGMALTKKFCRNFDLELQAQATENGVNIALSERHSFPLEDVFQFLSTETVVDVLEQAILQSPLFNTRFRWAANRSLSLLRFQGGKKVPPQIQRMRAEDLLTAVFPQAAACQDNISGPIEIPDHPLIKETMKDALTEALDVEGFIELLTSLKNGEIKTLAIDTPAPSVFSHEILNANPYAYLDDAPLEERRARAVELRRILPDSIATTTGKLDEYAIAQVKMEAWPDIRNADDLHDFLYTVIAAPPHLAIVVRESGMLQWSTYFRELAQQRRAGVATVAGNDYWVATERKAVFMTLFPGAVFNETLPDIEEKQLAAEEAFDYLIRGWMCYLGPVTAASLAELLRLPQFDIDVSLLRVESQGSILRGKFTGTEEEWCDRRLLSRIHRLTVDGLRRQIKPVSKEQFMLFLARWQHVAPGTQLVGVRGLQQILDQLQGFELPANAWESQILSKRVRKYNSEDLDKLCMTGAIGWGRISPHPATISSVENATKKLVFKRPRYGMPISRALSNVQVGVDEKLLPDLKVKLNSAETSKSNQSDSFVLLSNDENGENLIKEGSGRRVIPSSVSPMTFYLRQDCDWIAYCKRSGENIDQFCLSSNARLVFKHLNERGALFFSDLARFTGLLKSEIESALWELVAAGLATADGFDNLRSLIDPKRRSGQGSARDSRPRNATGRWSILGEMAPEEEKIAIESACLMLLNRYGVLFKDLLTRETTAPSWREMLPVLRRKEARGELRGGRFVAGFSGEQFALPSALESLRTNRDQPTETLKLIEVSSVDPLNLRGIILPGDKVPAISGRYLNLGDDTNPSFLREEIAEYSA